MATAPNMNVKSFVFINRNFTGALVVCHYSGGRVSAERLSEPDGSFVPISWDALPGVIRETVRSDGTAQMDDAQFLWFIDWLTASGWRQVFPKPAT